MKSENKVFVKRVSIGEINWHGKNLLFRKTIHRKCWLRKLSDNLSKNHFWVLGGRVCSVERRKPNSSRFIKTTDRGCPSKASDENVSERQFFQIQSEWALFNCDLNCGCSVNMFSLRFSVSKFLIDLRQQSSVVKFFVYNT